MTRKTRIIRTAAIAAATTLSVAGLAACSGGTSSGGSTDGAGTASGPVTIDYMHRLPDGEGMTKVADIVKKWNDEHPDIQVKATKFDGKASDMALKLETDVKAGNAPCLAQLSYGEVPTMYAKGLLQDVTADAANYTKDFAKAPVAQMTVGDALVGLPQDVGPLVYFYNEAEYTALGLSVPKTAADLTADSAKAAAAGKFVTAFAPDEAQYLLSAQAAAAGDSWFSVDGGKWKVDVNGAGSKQIAAFWQNLIDNKQTLTTERWGDGFTSALNDGKLIGHIGAAWEAGFLLDSLDGTPAEGKWRVAQLPDFGTGQTGPNGGSGVAVLKGCKNTKQALEFTDWFNTQVDDLATQGLVVAATAQPKTPEKMTRQFGGQDVLAVLSEASKNMNPDFPYAPGFPTLANMTATASKAIAGEAKVDDIFRDAQTTAVKALKDLKLPVAE